MVGEVACGVEELLRHDRRLQPDVRPREALPRLADLAAPLEPLARRGAVELDHHVVLQAAHPAGVEGDQLHDVDSLSLCESSFRLSLRAGGRGVKPWPAQADSAVPSGAVPSGAVPSGAVPSGAVPSGAGTRNTRS